MTTDPPSDANASAANEPAPAALPVFRYHPDPLATGSIVPAATVCRACGQARGYIYVGPVYAEAELEDCICPWCIADGTAHQRWDAMFTDMAAIGGDRWEAVPDAVLEAVAYRTPGFSSWQGEAWFTHCGDAAAFLGPMGRKDLAKLGPAAVAAIREEAGLDDDEWTDYYHGLERDGSPTAYLFRCLHCGTFGGYSDFD
jgi:uncharacterized protein CbrC (UPF0167 family)